MTDGHGTPLTLRALGRDLWDETFGLERGAGRTFVDLWRRPAVVAQRYCATRDPRYVRPLRYLLVAVAAYSAAAWLLLTYGDLAARMGLEPAQLRRMSFAIQHTGALVLVVVPLVAVVLWLLRRAWGLRLLEALVLVAYTQAQVLWAAVLIGMGASLLRWSWLDNAIAVLLFGYLAWAWSGLGGGRRWLAVVLAALAIVAGTLINDVVVGTAMRLFLD